MRLLGMPAKICNLSGKEVRWNNTFIISWLGRLVERLDLPSHAAVRILDGLVPTISRGYPQVTTSDTLFMAWG